MENKNEEKITILDWILFIVIIGLFDLALFCTIKFFYNWYQDTVNNTPVMDYTEEETKHKIDCKSTLVIPPLFTSVTDMNNWIKENCQEISTTTIEVSPANKYNPNHDKKAEEIKKEEEEQAKKYKAKEDCFYICAWDKGMIFNSFLVDNAFPESIADKICYDNCLEEKLNKYD